MEQELEAAFPQERLDKVVTQAIAHGASEEEFVEQRRKLTDEEIEAAMQDEDWRVRYAALDALEPTERHMIWKHWPRSAG